MSPSESSFSDDDYESDHPEDRALPIEDTGSGPPTQASSLRGGGTGNVQVPIPSSPEFAGFSPPAEGVTPAIEAENLHSDKDLAPDLLQALGENPLVSVSPAPALHSSIVNRWEHHIQHGISLESFNKPCCADKGDSPIKVSPVTAATEARKPAKKEFGKWERPGCSERRAVPQQAEVSAVLSTASQGSQQRPGRLPPAIQGCSTASRPTVVGVESQSAPTTSVSQGAVSSSMGISNVDSREVIREAFRRRNVPAAAVDTMLSALSASTYAQYNSCYRSRMMTFLPLLVFIVVLG
ncbi:hypothetical protein GE061_013718 [Apolygus lucorum]|uniref:Uncharacterized protein n=1 Tax=Apolygus lucorum TaxID=248454 RepID=A0A8S9XQM3_APOLU|nr:hypothetical protein GE061_013718 [Apolygus lucorum]